MTNTNQETNKLMTYWYVRLLTNLPIIYEEKEFVGPEINDLFLSYVITKKHTIRSSMDEVSYLVINEDDAYNADDDCETDTKVVDQYNNILSYINEFNVAISPDNDIMN
jgi:hypothetical protein